MTKEKTGDSNDNLDDSDGMKPLDGKHAVDPVDGKIKSEQQSEDEGNIDGKPPSIIQVHVQAPIIPEPTVIVKEKDKSEKIFGWIAAGTNVALAVITWLLYLGSVDQARSARESANAAIRAVEQSKSDNARMFDLSREALDSSINAGKTDDIRYLRDIAMQRSFLSAQLKMIDQASDQFQTDHSPFLFASDFILNDFDSTKILAIRYKIENSSLQRAKIVSLVSGVAIAPQPPLSIFDSIKYKKVGPATDYVVPGRPNITTYQNARLLPTNLINDLKAGKKRLFFYAEYIYQNELNNKTYAYDFIVMPILRQKGDYYTVMQRNRPYNIKL